jgi:hypothetical protein
MTVRSMASKTSKALAASAVEIRAGSKSESSPWNCPNPRSKTSNLMSQIAMRVYQSL